MGKASRTKSRPVARVGSADPKSAGSMPEVTTPREGLTSPQLTALASLAVAASTAISLRRAVNLDGVGSPFCDFAYAEHEGGCSESDLFFVALRYRRSLAFLGLYVGALLLCWSDAPLLQRLNHCLCVSPVSATMAAVTAQAGKLDRRYIMRTGLTHVALFVLTNNSYRAGMVPWRKVRANAQDLTLAAAAAAAAGYGACAAFLGPGGVSDFDAADVHDGSRAQLVFAGIEYSNVAVLAAFALFFLDDVRKRVMMLYTGIAALAQAFLHLPREREHLAGAGPMTDVLFGTAVALLLFAVLPSRGPKGAAASGAKAD